MPPRNVSLLIHKEKSRFPFSATAHRDFEIFKKAVLDFCGVQSLAEAKRPWKKHRLLVYKNRPFWNCGEFLYLYPETMAK